VRTRIIRTGFLGRLEVDPRLPGGDEHDCTDDTGAPNMKVAITGTGAAVPPVVMGNEKLLRLFPGPRTKPWTVDEFETKTGIHERRFCFDLDDRTGRAIMGAADLAAPGPAGRLAEAAVWEALATADVEPAELDGLVVGSCTPDTLHFGGDGQLLHHRLGMRPDALVLQTDIGCAGAPLCLQWAKEMILGGVRRRIAVVLVHVMSPLFDRDLYGDRVDADGGAAEAFLTTLLFGDGAGAVVLEAVGDDSPSEMVSSVTTNEMYPIAVRPGGGGLRPPGLPSTAPTDHAFYILGRRVAQAYAPRMTVSIHDALRAAGMSVSDISRFYPHQSNRRLIEQLIDRAGLAEDRTAIHVDRYGNTSGASVLILLAEDVRKGVVSLGSGEPVTLAAIGANLQNGAHVIRL